MRRAINNGGWNIFQGRETRERKRERERERERERSSLIIKRR